MKVRITSLTDLANEVMDVVSRTPHARAIHPVVQEMHKYVANKLVMQRDELFWFYRNGSPSRSVWVLFNGHDYYFNYDPRTTVINLKSSNRLGVLLETFSAADTANDIARKLSPYFP